MGKAASRSSELSFDFEPQEKTETVVIGGFSVSKLTAAKFNILRAYIQGGRDGEATAGHALEQLLLMAAKLKKGFADLVTEEALRTYMEKQEKAQEKTPEATEQTASRKSGPVAVAAGGR
jgi:hypothetical protein